MHAETRCELLRAVVELHFPCVEPPHHRDHVLGFEWIAHDVVAHVTAGAVLHLAFLQVIARFGEQRVVAAVIVVHVTDDHIFDIRRIDADRFQTFCRMAHDLALALFRDVEVEAGVEDERR